MIDSNFISKAINITPIIFSDWNILIPVLIPLFFSGISIVLRSKNNTQYYCVLLAVLITMISSTVLFIDSLTNIPKSLTMGGWLSPYGITFTVDKISAIFIFISSLIVFLILIYNISSIDKDFIKSGYYTLILTLLVGVNGSFMASDIFNLYVWFEVILISSFGLLILGGKKKQLDGAIKYIFINLLGTTFFLIAIALIYGITGALNLADLYQKIEKSNEINLISTISVIFLFALGIKSAVFPMLFWLPATYHTPCTSVSAIFAGLLTKVGLYAIIRIFFTIFLKNNNFIFEIFTFLGSCTVLIGGIGALAQINFQRMLGYILISGVGIIMIGIGIGTYLSMLATIQYMVYSMLIMTGLYLFVGIINYITKKSKNFKIGSIVEENPFISICYFGLILSIIGLPPFFGLWPKYILLQSAFINGNYLLIIIMLIGTFLTIIGLSRISMQIIWHKNFININHRYDKSQKKKLIFMMIPIVIIFIISFLLGIYPEFLIYFVHLAVEELFNIDLYINSVLQNR